MKKLLVLFVMLALASSALASVASASVIVKIDVNGGPWDGSSVKPSDIVRITMSDEASLPGGFGDFHLGVSQGDPVSASMLADFTIIPGSIITTVDNCGIDYAMYGMSFPNSPAGDIFEVEFHVPDVPASTIIDIGQTLGSWNGNFNAIEPIGIHVIPEPLTLSLLGLGGLGLLRRRRA